jgi:hypothetical protein
MKKIILAVLLMSGASAMADVNTICNGEGHTIEIAHASNKIGSASDVALLNGQEVESIYEGAAGDIFTFSLQISGHVLTLDYNQMEATAQLTGQGIHASMFCSRYY